MSKGFGALQSEILQLLPEVGSISANTVCWRMAEDSASRLATTLSHRSTIAVIALAPSFYKSFRRALNRLIDEGDLLCEKRKLASWDEFLAVYPDKSQRKDVRAARRRLLPLLGSYTSFQPLAINEASNELHLVAALREDTAAWKKAVAAWRRVDTAIVEALSAANSEQLEALVDLMIKGREFYTSRQVSTRSTLTSIVSHSLPAPVDQLARRLHDLTFPGVVLPHAKLKGILYEVGAFGSRDKRATLHEHILCYLYLNEPDFVASLDGQVLKNMPSIEGTSAQDAKWLEQLLKERGLGAFEHLGAYGQRSRPHPEVTWAPVLWDLVDRHAFDSFEFLSRC